MVRKLKAEFEGEGEKGEEGKKAFEWGKVWATGVKLADVAEDVLAVEYSDKATILGGWGNQNKGLVGARSVSMQVKGAKGKGEGDEEMTPVRDLVSKFQNLANTN